MAEGVSVTPGARGVALLSCRRQNGARVIKVQSDANVTTQDSIQQKLAGYANALCYQAIPPEAAHAAKLRIIDTLGALVGGFFAEPCLIARNLAAQTPTPHGATVLGTRVKT